MADIYAFGQAVTELQLRLGGRTDSSSGVPFQNRCQNWLNSAQLLLARAPLEIPGFDTGIAVVNLVPGQNEYFRGQFTPPMLDVIGTQIVSISDSVTGNQLRMRKGGAFSEYRSLSQLPSIMPTIWYRRGNLIAFNAFPDRTGYAVKFDYRAKPVLNQIAVEGEWQETMIQVAKWLAWSALDNEQKAQAALAELPATIQRAIQSPLDEEQWESMWDPDEVIAPSSFQRGWSYVS